MAAFWSMGGYGLYVWSAYALTGLVLAGNVLVPWLRLRRVRQALAGSALGSDDEA